MDVDNDLPPLPSGPSTAALITIIIFAILFFVLLAVVSYYLSIRNKLIACQNNPNVWCFNDWACVPNIPAGTPGVNICYTNNGTIDSNGNSVKPPGLVNCLIGPDSQAAKVCGAPNPLCACDIPSANNCFQVCPGCLNGQSCTNPSPVNPTCCTKGNCQAA
jgi:hypothetical protein